jgi:hypothetical protein
VIEKFCELMQIELKKVLSKCKFIAEQSKKRPLNAFGRGWFLAPILTKAL